MSNKECPSCGQNVEETAKFCPNCGFSLSKKKPAKNQPKKTSQKSNGLRDTLIIAGVLVIVIVGFFIYKQPAEKPVQQNQPNLGAGHPDVAMDDGTSSVLANLPTDYESLVQLGHQTMDNNNFALAAECYRRALKIDGSSNDVRTDYGACLHGMGLPMRALQEFQTVLKNDPKHNIANFNSGIVFYSIQQPDSAKVYFKKYLDIDPTGKAAPDAKRYLQELGG